MDTIVERRTRCLLRHLGMANFVATSESPEDLKYKLSLALCSKMEESQLFLPSGVEMFNQDQIDDFCKCIRTFFKNYNQMYYRMTLQERILKIGELYETILQNNWVCKKHPRFHQTVINKLVEFVYDYPQVKVTLKRQYDFFIESEDNFQEFLQSLLNVSN